MKKIKIKNRLIILLFFCWALFVINGKNVKATIVDTDYTTQELGVCECDWWNPTCGPHGEPVRPCMVDVHHQGKAIVVNNVSYASIDNPYLVATCKADSRIKEFCTDLVTCNGEINCSAAIMSVYDKKMTSILQAVIDEKISDAGLDKSKANTAVESCGGDLSCIDKVLSVLQTDSSYAEGSTDNSTEPLTAASLSDMINDSTSSSTTNPMNSASNQASGASKLQGPKLDLTFNSTGALVQGTSMTATAVPSFFKDDAKKLYFTWYLKRSGCELTDSDDPSGKKGKLETDSGKIAKCDLDSDQIITVNDWKIAAARIVVGKSFDSSEAVYEGVDLDEKAAGYKSMPSPVETSTDEKDDIWKINAGAEENDEDAPNCYVQEPKSGSIYEMRRVQPVFNDCPTGYHRACVSDQVAKCATGLNPSYSQAAADAAANAVPPQTYNVPKTISSDFNACAILSEESDNDDVSCGIDNETDLKNFKATIECDQSGAQSLCVKNGYLDMELKDDSQKLWGIIVGTKPGSANSVANNDKMCTAVAREDSANSTDVLKIFLPNTSPKVKAENEKCAVVKDRMLNGTKNTAGSTIITGNPSLQPKCSFEKDVNMCKHLFPVVPSSAEINGKNIDMEGAVTGDGKFTIEEKQFWGADPLKADTNGTGKDEEQIVGLGVDSFTWMFSPGDQIGVIVEGDSDIATDHADSSYKRMWAFSNNVCTKLEDLDKKSNLFGEDADENKNKRGFYVEGSGVSSSGILTAEFDLNKCLEENLLDPDASDSAKLAVQLNASPSNPINDASGRGDVLSIIASPSNSQDSSGLLYKWTIQKSRDGSTAPIDTTSWVDITSKAISNQSVLATDVAGLDKKTLDVNLNFPESLISDGIAAGKYTGVFYLKIKVNITGAAVDGSQDAAGNIIVRVGQQQNEIISYQVVANNSGMLSLDNGTSSTPLCDDAAGRSTCYVTKNEIIGLSVPNTSNSSVSNIKWKVNGVEMACSSNISTQCAGSTNFLFFPILGNVGEAVDVVAIGKNSKNESVEVSRHFVIVEPQIQIIALDQGSVWPKLLGYYKDLNGNKYPDYSTQVFEANAGNAITLGAAFYPQTGSGRSGFDWAIDGQVLPDLHNQTQIKMSIDKSVGDSYNIGLVAFHIPGSDEQVNNIRKALLKNWSISPEEVIEQNGSTNVQLDVMEGNSAITKADSKIFGASLITHLPEPLMFVFKISITSILMLLMTSLLFAFMPETLFAAKERE